MSKFSIAQIEAIDRERRCREKELNSALCLKRFTSQDRLVPELDTVVYRLEFPKMRDAEDMLKLFYRVAGMMAYHIRKLGNENEMIAIIGYSEHKAWTPYAKVYGKKGGRGKKVFMHAEATKRVPHIHIYLSGRNSRKISERIWETQRKYWSKNFPHLRYPAFKHFAYTSRHFPDRYVKEQSSHVRMFGDIDSYIDTHRIDDDPLDIEG